MKPPTRTTLKPLFCGFRSRKKLISGFAIAGLIVCGCTNTKERVFVDLLERNDTFPPNNTFPPLAGSQRVALSDTPGNAPTSGFATTPKDRESTAQISALSMKTISTERPGEMARLQASLRRESEIAIENLASRLDIYYQKDYDTFYNELFAKLGPEFGAVREQFRAQGRQLFELAAKERAPVLLRLVILTEFPPPEIIVTPATPPSVIQAKRQQEIRELQRKLLSLDTAYADATNSLDEQLRAKLGERTEEFTKRLDAKQREIGERALQEARSQITNSNASVSTRLTKSVRINLPAAPAILYTPPKLLPPKALTGVTSRSRIPSATIPLSQQVKLWSELHGYELSTKVSGGRNATKEFLEWKKQLEFGR